MRRTIGEEFSDIYIFNLRGNGRIGGVAGRAEGRPVFEFAGWNADGSERKSSTGGSRATITISVLVRDPKHVGPARITYAQVTDMLSAGQKLKAVDTAESVKGMDSVQHITPNEHGDWLNQRRKQFDQFVSIDSIIAQSGRGLETGRDAWVYNYSMTRLLASMRRAITTYRSDLQTRHETLDPTTISWTATLRSALKRALPSSSAAVAQVGKAAYRPYTKSNAYGDPFWIHRPAILRWAFPTPLHNNYGFYANTGGTDRPFCVLHVDAVPDLNFFGQGGQFFARWRYEKVEPDDGTLSFGALDEDASHVIGGYRKVDNITDAALANFRAAYGDSIAKDDIFHYVYGLLHSPDYRSTYAADLKRTLPRIPLVTDATPFIAAGEALMKLHLGYENAERYPLEGLNTQPTAGRDAYDFFAVQKMKFAKTRDPETKKLVADKSSIVYNAHITLAGIPQDAYRYMLGSRSAVEWIIDRYQVKTDKPSGIVNDPNDWSREVGDPRYILDLLARIVTVSLETMKIVDALPALKIRAEQS